MRRSRVANGIGVPAGHDRRTDRDPVLVVDGAGHADHHGPRRGCVGAAGHLLAQRLQVRLDGGEHRLRTVGDVDVDVHVRPHRLAEVDDGEVRAVRAEVGDEHVPAPRGERQPVRRPAAPGGRPGADDPQHAAAEQRVDAVAHGRAGEPGGLDEVGLADRGAGGDQPGQRAERDRAVEAGRERRRGQAQRRERSLRFSPVK